MNRVEEEACCLSRLVIIADLISMYGLHRVLSVVIDRKRDMELKLLKTLLHAIT